MWKSNLSDMMKSELNKYRELKLSCPYLIIRVEPIDLWEDKGLEVTPVVSYALEEIHV